MTRLENISPPDLEKKLKATCDSGESSIAVLTASTLTGAALYDTVFVLPCIIGAGVSLIVNICMGRRRNRIISVLCSRDTKK